MSSRKLDDNLRLPAFAAQETEQLTEITLSQLATEIETDDSGLIFEVVDNRTLIVFRQPEDPTPEQTRLAVMGAELLAVQAKQYAEMLRVWSGVKRPLDPDGGIAVRDPDPDIRPDLVVLDVDDAQPAHPDRPPRRIEHDEDDEPQVPDPGPIRPIVDDERAGFRFRFDYPLPPASG